MVQVVISLLKNSWFEKPLSGHLELFLSSSVGLPLRVKVKDVISTAEVAHHLVTNEALGSEDRVNMNLLTKFLEGCRLITTLSDFIERLK